MLKSKFFFLCLTIVPSSSSFLPSFPPKSEVQQSDLVSFCFALNWRFLTLSLSPPGFLRYLPWARLMISKTFLEKVPPFSAKSLVLILFWHTGRKDGPLFLPLPPWHEYLTSKFIAGTFVIVAKGFWISSRGGSNFIDCGPVVEKGGDSSNPPGKNKLRRGGTFFYFQKGGKTQCVRSILVLVGWDEGEGP